MSVSEWSGRPDEPKSPETVPSVAAPGRTPAADGDRTPEGRTGDLRAELATILAVAFHGADYRKDDPGRESTLVSFIDTDGLRSLRPLRLGEIADAVLTAGYRLVSEDDTTVDRVAAAIFNGFHHWSTWGDDVDEMERDRYRAYARLAVRAFREGQ